MRSWRLIGAFFLVAATAGCNQSDFGDPPGLDDDEVPEPPPGPGTDEWGDEDLSCTTAGDCGAGETCSPAGMCVPARCDDGPYDSGAPLGPRHLFFTDMEIAVADADASGGSYYVDLYMPANQSVAYKTGGGSYNLGSVSATDVAAGNLTGTQVQGVATAIAGSSSLTIFEPQSGQMSLSVGFVPVALAAGDVDGDGLDELIALGQGGKLALCEVDDRTCTGYEIDTDRPSIGLAAADIDGDTQAEPLILLGGDGSQLLAWNTDAEESGEASLFGGSYEAVFGSIAAGDFDGDRIAEVALLEDGGWLGLAHDRLHLYDLSQGQVTGMVAADVFRSATDVDIADLDGDDMDDVVVLGGGDVQVLGWNGQNLVESYTGSLGTTGSPSRLALVDIDGDSASGRLVSGPELVAGPTKPTFVMTFPPYDAQHADGNAKAVLGRRTEISETLTDSVSLSLGVEVGVEASFLDIFKTKVYGKVEQTVTRRRGVKKTLRIGDRFSLEPQPALYGYQYGAVVMSCGCFHAYEYELEDPSGRVGGNGSKFVLMVPVGGNTTVWSTPRYNALAEATGDLPPIEVSGRLGDPTTYPQAPTTLEGAAIAADDLVFPQSTSYRVSDVGDVGFQLWASEYEINEVAATTEVSVGWSVGAGVQFGIEAGGALGRAYRVAVGETAIFSGAVPPIPDNPSTPEDEYEVHNYSFEPVVYRQTYDDAEGGESGYYVLTYAVGAD